MSFVSHRRALVITGLTGMLLAGGALATSSAAYADDSASDGSATAADVVAPQDAKLTVADAAETAQEQYPDCAVTGALLYDSGEEAPLWDVELTCDSGTVKYLSIDADDGSVTNDGSDTSDSDTSSTDSSGTDDGSTSTDPNDAAGTGDNADYDD